jgi:hypothetical protein
MEETQNIFYNCTSSCGTFNEMRTYNYFDYHFGFLNDCFQDCSQLKYDTYTNYIVTDKNKIFVLKFAIKTN